MLNFILCLLVLGYFIYEFCKNFKQAKEKLSEFDFTLLSISVCLSANFYFIFQFIDIVFDAFFDMIGG